VATRASGKNVTYHHLERYVPLLPVFSTAEDPLRHLKVPSLDSNGFSIDERIRKFAASRSQNSMKSGAGDAHLFGTGFLFSTFQIFETYCLRLFHRNLNCIEHVQRNPDRLEMGDRRQSPYSSPLWRSRHYLFSYAL